MQYYFRHSIENWSFFFDYDYPYIKVFITCSNQNYNKILERYWLSPARFEHS